MNFGIIEIGSTNTKAYIFKKDVLNNFGSKHIAFKDNYKALGKLSENDIKSLYDFIGEIKKEVTDIYAFGTSIFRNITKEDLKVFTKQIESDLKIKFKVVTAYEETTYTVKGAINNIGYEDKMAVVIGGGGSTELAIIENKEIVKRYYFDFGAMDITDRFPDLKDDTSITDFNTIFEYTSNLIKDLNETAETLVLAGGDYIYYYEKANYKLENNFLYQDTNQPYLLDFNQLNQYDHDMMNKSFDQIRYENQDNIGWWDGARGMRFCMNAIATKIQAKYIIPTRINMLIGITDEILQSKKNKDNQNE